MSFAAELALIRDAYEALPQGTPQERTAWILKRKRELQAEAQPSTAQVKTVARSVVQPFSQIADHPDVKRTGGSE